VVVAAEAVEEIQDRAAAAEAERARWWHVVRERGSAAEHATVDALASDPPNDNDWRSSGSALGIRPWRGGLQGRGEGVGREREHRQRQ
jgi:hypothetical protein